MNTKYGLVLIMMTNTDSPRLAVTPGEWYASDMLTPMRIDLRQMNGIPEVIGAMYVCRTVWGFPQIDSTAVDCDTGAVELDDLIFHKLSAGRDGDYIWLALLAGLSVRTRSVTGSLRFGYPHRLVCSCFCSTILSLRWLESVDVPQGRHCRTTVVRNTPDICSSCRTLCIEGYLFMPSVIVILIIWCCFGVFKVRDMVFD